MFQACSEKEKERNSKKRFFWLGQPLMDHLFFWPSKIYISSISYIVYIRVMLKDSATQTHIPQPQRHLYYAWNYLQTSTNF